VTWSNSGSTSRGNSAWRYACGSRLAGTQAEYAGTMIYRWLVRKQAAAGWQRLSEQRFDETPLADDMHFVFLGDHRLAADIRGADAVREWLRDQLLRRLPNLRFVVDETLLEGGRGRPAWRRAITQSKMGASSTEVSTSGGSCGGRSSKK
jgi:hypothetical protein